MNSFFASFSDPPDKVVIVNSTRKLLAGKILHNNFYFSINKDSFQNSSMHV